MVVRSNSQPTTSTVDRLHKTHRLPSLNTRWDTRFEWELSWIEHYLQMTLNPWTSGLRAIKTIALPVKSALQADATRENIMKVLKVCVSFGREADLLAVPILAES